MRVIEWYLDIGSVKVGECTFKGTLEIEDGISNDEIDKKIIDEIFSDATYNWTEKKKYCKNCHHYAESEGVCCNGESEYRADFTDEYFDCKKWEEKQTGE